MDQIEGYSYFLPLLGKLESEEGYVITATNKDFYDLLHDLLKRFNKNYYKVATLSNESAPNDIRRAVDNVFAILFEIGWSMVQDITVQQNKQTWFNDYMISFFRRNGIDVELYRYYWEISTEAERREKHGAFLFERKQIPPSLVQNLDLNLRL